jgi:hypothetical protein
MMQSNRQKQARIAEIIMAVIPIMVIVTMLTLGWRKWPDILVDFGREMYLPWQVSAGKVLYRDLEHVFGPLSVYANAALFSLFGSSFTVLFTANIIIYVLFMIFLYYFLRQISSSVAASVTCSFLPVVTLSQNTIGGNYNFISPYSHEAIHGLMLSMLLLYQLWRFSANGRSLHLFVGGVLFGCVLLTRVEIALIVFIVTISFIVLLQLRSSPSTRLLVPVLLFAVGTLLPIAAFAAYFTSVSSAAGSLQFMLSPWRFMLDPGITATSFYRAGMGLDDLSGNLLRMSTGGAIYLLPLFVLMVMSTRRNNLPKWLYFALAIYLSVSAWFWSDKFLFPALPLIVAVIMLFLLCDYWRGDSAQRQTVIPLLLIAIFSLGVLSKMLLNCRIYQYGFYITLPALVLVSVVLIWYLPHWLEKRGGGGTNFRRAMILFLVVLSVHYLWKGAGFFRLKTYPVALAQNDRIMAFQEATDARGLLVDKALQWIDRNVPRNQSMLVVPEGVLLNFLARRENPTRYNNFMLPELIHYGEDAILREFILHQPDVVLFVLGKDSSEYGVGPFGLDPDNGKMIVDWIESAYHPVMTYGGDPLEGNALGIKIYYQNVAHGGNAPGVR